MSEKKENTAPSFSIVTCTWNSAATLMDTVRSVQLQHNNNVEHIFVDGGSTDATLDLIAEHCPSAIVLKGVSGGISRAMNAGIDAASGDIVSHLHSDDFYLDGDVLARVVRAFADVPDAQWAFGKISVFDGEHFANDLAPARPYTFRRYAAGRVSIPHPAVFIRRDVFHELGYFDVNLKYAMDIDLWMRFGQVHFPLQIDARLTAFREHPGSLSTANKAKARMEEWLARRRYFRDAPIETVMFGVRHWRRMRRLAKQGNG